MGKKKEYIERGAFLRKCAEALGHYGVAIKAIEGIVDECTAADVVEVVHGEWISVESDVIFKCSICDAEVSTSWDYENEDMFKYCPCCGARMDGERKEQNNGK